jgi:hypothetical protein
MMKKLMMAAVLGMACVTAMTENVTAQVADGLKFNRGGAVPDINFIMLSEEDGVAIPDTDSSIFSGYFKGAIRNFRYLGSAKPYPTAESPLSFCSATADLKARLIDGGKTAEYTVIAPNQFNLSDGYKIAINPDPNSTNPPTTNLSTTVQPGAFYIFTVDLSTVSPQDKLQYISSLPFIIQNSYTSPLFKSDDFVARAFQIYLFLPGSSATTEAVTSTPTPCQ